MKKIFRKIVAMTLVLAFVHSVLAESPFEAPVRHGDGFKIEIDGQYTADKFDTYRKALHALQEAQINNPDSIVKLVPDWYETVNLVAVSNPTDPKPTEPPVTGINCTVTISPSENINSSFGLINEGEALCLEDGTYNQNVVVPSNKTIAAVNINKAVITYEGDDSVKDVLLMAGSNSAAIGLKVVGVTNYYLDQGTDKGNYLDACDINGTNNTARYLSCSHAGGYTHSVPLRVSGSGHLIENNWAFGKGRYVIFCGGNGDNITMRQNVARWDSTNVGETNEPNAAYSNYYCHNMIWENNISLDYGVPDTLIPYCGDFCMSTGTRSGEGNRDNRFLGNIVVGHEEGTNNNRAFRADNKSGVTSSGLTIHDMYMKDSEVGLVIHPDYSNIDIQNCTSVNFDNDGAIGWGSSVVNVVCDDNADVINKYNYGNKTNESLWPWVLEELIKADMCSSNERQSTWCQSNQTLTQYIGVF